MSGYTAAYEISYYWIQLVLVFDQTVIIVASGLQIQCCLLCCYRILGLHACGMRVQCRLLQRAIHSFYSPEYR
jgi:hypothetical protein